MKKTLLFIVMVLAFVVSAHAQVPFAGGVTGSVTVNCVPKATVANTITTTVICSDGTSTTVGANKVVITEANGNTSIAGTLAVTGNTAITGTLVTTGTMNGPFGATRVLTTPVVLTSAQSGQLQVVASTADAVTTFTLPAASTAGLRYCFAADSVSGSNREIDVEPPTGSDLIIGTTTSAGGTGIATTAGAGHGIKNTHATAVRGNAVCLQSDGVNTWYMTSLSGVWASY